MSFRYALMRRFAACLVLAGALAGAGGCYAAVRVYDQPRHDYHRWDDREERAYRAYLLERRRDYVEFRLLAPREQDEYWAWRHGHSDRDRNRG
jgi:hypothetical protein